MSGSGRGLGKPTAVMPQGGSFLLYEGKSGDDFWVSATRSQAVKSLRTGNGFPLFGELIV